MDEVDRAQRAEQVATAAAIRAATQRRRSADAPCRACLNCDEPLQDGLRYCDSDCRDDYLRRLAKQENDRVLRGLG